MVCENCGEENLKLGDLKMVTLGYDTELLGEDSPIEIVGFVCPKCGADMNEEVNRVIGEVRYV